MLQPTNTTLQYITYAALFLWSYSFRQALLKHLFLILISSLLR